MKKWKTVLILTLLLCIIPCCAALATTGKVSVSSLNMREKASTGSKIIVVLRQGATVTITGTTGSWYKITAAGKTGYVCRQYISVTNNKNNNGKTQKTENKDGTCGPGDTGSNVRKVQQRLKKLGYYSGSIDGDYGNGTRTAVRNFQKRNGLTADGKVGPKTLAKLNSSGAKKATAEDKADNNGKITTERLNWFKGGSNKIPKGATFKVKDIRSGKVFTAKRWSGGNHLDAEPLTAKDTATLKSIYGGWSWRRRAILVKYNGHVYAASMNGMPHGTQTISGNNFNGHFCIHFYGSKTHGSKRVDAMHQNCVAEAMKHTW